MGSAKTAEDVSIDFSVDEGSGVTAAWRTRPWLPSGWECRGRRLSNGSNPALRLYRKLVIRTTSLVWFPFASSNCCPSRDQEKSKMSPEVKLVNCLGSPPASDCSQTLVAPLRVSKYCNPFPSGDQRNSWK